MKRLSPGVRFLLGFITFLLCIVLFVTTVAGILVSNVAQVLSSQENLENLLRQVLFVDMHKSISLRNAPIGNTPSLRQAPVKNLAPSHLRLSEQQTATSMVDWIYEALAEDFGDELQVDLETVKEFVERSTLDDFLVEKGAALINDVYTGENTVTLGADEIKEKIEENAALIEEYFGVPVDTQVITDVTTVIEKNEYVTRIEEEGIVNIIMNPQGSTTPDGNENPNSVDTQQIQKTIETVRTVVAMQTVMMVAGAVLLLILLILLVNIKQIWVGLNKAGVTLMCGALPFVILTVAVWVMPAGWTKIFQIPAIIEVVVNQIMTLNAAICFGVFGFGLLMLLAGTIVCCIANRKYQKAQEQKKLEEKLLNEIPMPEVKFVIEDEAAEDAAEEAPIEEEDTEEEASEEEIAEEEADEAASEEDPAEEETEEETSEEETTETL